MKRTEEIEVITIKVEDDGKIPNPPPRLPPPDL